MQQILVGVHLATVLFAFPVGAWMLLSRKGTRLHKLLGKPYMLVMFITGVVTLFMPAQVGPQLLGHFGFLHLFSVLVLVSVPASIYAIRHGNVPAHQGSMIGVYLGGILVAGAFALMPGRLLHTFLFT